MRAGGCTVQQALTAEAATVVKQAVTLARRRGHAQVTPLHVANTMLASSTGLLRTACLQSHSHPLQCKALELCFNVALNRLPASTSSPMLSSHNSQHQYPSISNALVAAFKRAQAHQRRGSIENQQQPLLAVKIELEQLIISILDDPSVSRVMREAGFSSTQVKSNVEQAVSLEICSQSATPPPSSLTSKSQENNNNNLSVTQKNISKPVRNEDITSVIESLMNKRKRNIVIVGECISSLETVVNGVMDKITKGDVPEILREVRILPFSISSFGQLSRPEVDHKFEEMKELVRRYLNKGVILNLGDLKWVIENRDLMEYMIMEIGKLLGFYGNGENNNGKFWILGISTFQTYMKYKSNHPSLETVWGLHPLTIPAGSLCLSLIINSDTQSQSISNNKADQNCWIILENEDQEKKLSCCPDCTAKFENEARSLQISSTCNSDSTSTTLPAWLQQCKNENKIINRNDQDCVSMKDLCEKWNSICNSIHRPPYSSEKTITFSSVSPSSSTSVFSYENQYPNLHQTHYHHQDWPMVEPKQQAWRDRDRHFRNEPSLRMYIPEHTDFLKHPFSSNPNSTSSSDFMEMEHLHKFKELNAENLKIMCNSLEKKVPWQKDIILEIARTILQCRSGIVRRKGKARNGITTEVAKEETWLFFQGVDMEAKEIIGKELARLVFGSLSNFISIALSSFSSTRTADSTEDCRNKRSRDEHSCSYIERFSEALSRNPHRVFLIEDVEQADYCSQMGFKRAIESGKISKNNGEEVFLGDAIIILSCESFSSRSRACSPPIKQKVNGTSQDQEEKGSVSVTMEETIISPCVSLDLNISIEDDSTEDESIDDVGLLESVDRRVIFKVPEL